MSDVGQETPEQGQQPYTVRTQSPDGCLVLKQSNTSYANWENIPETALLNGVFGLILFIFFLIFTHMAWRRTGQEESIYSQTIINFLYGYRDPEHWYVIPRYEFLRPKERHHQHDLAYQYLYIPPKLPITNPIEAFVYDSDMGKETDLNVGTKSSSDQLNIAMQQDLERMQKQPQQSISIAENSEDTKIFSLMKQQKSTINNVKTSSSTGFKMSKSTEASKLVPNTSSKAFGQSFIYPSILTAEQLRASYLSRKLNRIFAIFFRVTDADIIYARGIDAYEYLLFQRHLILIMVITNMLCLGVILPIHWFAGTNVNLDVVLTTSFQRTTIKNMSAKSHYHWAHIVCSIIIVIAAIRIMSSYKESITSRNDSQLSRRTLLIGNIPKDQRNRAQLSRTLIEYFSPINIEAIQFVYDFSSLYDYEAYLSCALVAKEYCRAYRVKHNRELMVNKTDVNLSRYCDGYCRLCSFFYISCCYWSREDKVPGVEYYASQESIYRDKIAKACERMVNEPTEYAFVTFKTHKQARRVLQDLAHLKQEAIEDGQASSLIYRSRNHILDSTLGVQSESRLAKSKSASPKATVRKPSKGKQTKSKYLESGNLDNDPMDPENNPHVRSIRSPQIIDKNRAANAIKQHKNSRIEPSSYSSKEETKSNRSGSSRETALAPSKLEEGPLLWSVRYAPHPDNVEFNDLRYLARVSKYTGILLHLLMIVIFIFITTPNVLLSMIERITIIRPDRARELTGFQSLMINYFSIMLQVIMTALLPSLITLISKQIPYEDSSSKNHSVMWKVYLFLVLMVIIMPSIGMSSAQSLLVSDIDPKCLFPTDNGAYFINYVISSTFLSIVLELIKPTDVIYYYFILWTSRSTAELEGGRQFIEREFSVGLQHTSVLLIFSVVMTYAMSCPLIAPVGLVYLIFKHAVDHYHLYYTYFTKRVDKNMQATIVIFVKVGILLMLFQTTVAISLNTGTSYYSLISQIIFWITLAALAFNCFFDFTSRNIPSSLRRSRFSYEFCACFYLPRVVDNLLKVNAIPQKYISRKS